MNVVQERNNPKERKKELSIVRESQKVYGVLLKWGSTIVFLLILFSVGRWGYNFYQTQKEANREEERRQSQAPRIAPPPAPQVAGGERDSEVWVRFAPVGNKSEPIMVTKPLDFCIHPKGRVRVYYVSYNKEGDVIKRNSFRYGPGMKVDIGKLTGLTEFSFMSLEDARVEVRGRESCF